MRLQKQMTETYTERLGSACLCVADIISVADARVNSFISLATPN